MLEKIIFGVLFCYLVIGFISVMKFQALIALLKENGKTREKALARFPHKMPWKSKLKITIFWPYYLFSFSKMLYKYKVEKERENKNGKSNFQARLEALAKNPPMESTHKSNFQTKLEKIASKKI